MFHWMLVASQAIKSVLRVANFFSNKKRRTFSRSLYAHISLQVKHLTQVCEGEKQSQFLSNTLPLWFWWRMRLVVHFRDKILSFMCCGTSCFKNHFSSQCQKESASYFNQYSRIFSSILAGQRAQIPISLPPVIASAISSIVFFDDTSWRSSATAQNEICDAFSWRVPVFSVLWNIMFQK